MAILFFNSSTKGMREYFTTPNPDKNQSNTVDMPINTTTSCQNKCAPPSICSITGEQCTSDSDCYGCQPNNTTNKIETTDIRGDNDAGKLTLGVTPNYSTLTTDIGTQAAFYDKTQGKNLLPPTYFKGVDQWRKSFDVAQQLYDKRYNPNIETLPYLPKYPRRHTLSGEFVDDGPLASNDFL